MSSYYQKVIGNIRAGDVAKAYDINNIQTNIEDALRLLLNDLHDGESYIIDSGDNAQSKNAFTITPAEKKLGQYIDANYVFELKDTQEYFNLNNYDIKQPIPLTQTALYSVIVAMKNESSIDITVDCELWEGGQLNNPTEPLKRNTITIPANTTSPKEFEIVFGLNHYPTALGLNQTKLKENDGKDIANDTQEEDYDEGSTHTNEDSRSLTNGVSVLYLVLKRTNLNQIDLAEEYGDDIVFNPDSSLGVFFGPGTDYTEQKTNTKISSNGLTWEEQNATIFHKAVYSKGLTYSCTGGRAVINGEPVDCLDSFVNIETSSEYGNVLSTVYMDSDGHLKSVNSKAMNSTNIDDFSDDIDDENTFEAGLPIAKILNYASTIENYNKEPLIIQTDTTQTIRPRSHHERIRRLEKHVDWLNDIAVPSRMKYTLTGESFIDTQGELIENFSFAKDGAEDVDNLAYNYITTTDSNGNIIVRSTNSQVHNIKITLKDVTKNEDGTVRVFSDDDILNASQFSSISGLTNDTKNGTLELSTVTKDNTSKVGLTAKQAKETTFNPWDDIAANRPKNANIKPTERKYTVKKGKGHDNDSKYPGMTLYCSKNYKLKGLTIPIKKFQDCSGVTFYIWRRQSTNNKKNVVNNLEKKIYTSKTFSLKNAKVKGKYQYVNEGFTIKFGKDGLSLKKGQYVIIAVPIPKKDTGSLFVETYKPKSSRDFCIVYKGASNASHFNLVGRYQEVWYNSASATVVEEDYSKKGTAISKTITWTGDDLQKIKYVRPVVNKNLTTPQKNNCTAKIFADTGNGWQEVKPEEDNLMNGGAKTFRWKIEFTSNGKSTPKLAYNKDNDYAISFILTRDNIKATNNSEINSLDKNLSITSVPFDGNNILREYIGDTAFNKNNDRFSNFEFARVWATPEENKTLSIDISASDAQQQYTKDGVTGGNDVWTLHYCDLTLNDFDKISVDYSNYTEDLEYDENNMRLKLDTDHSYNDDDIKVFSENKFKKQTNSIDTTTGNKLILNNNSEIKKNQVLLKATFDNPVDLTKYTSLRFKFSADSSKQQNLAIKGLGIYISSTLLEKTPSTFYDIEETDENGDSKFEMVENENVLSKTIIPGQSNESDYIDKILVITRKESNGNKASEDTLFYYSQEFDTSTNSIIYVRRQYHDYKPYNIYQLPTINIPKYTGSKENPEPVDVSYRIEINQNSTNLKYVKEIGIIALNEITDDDLKYDITGTNVGIELTDIVGAKEDYYPIFKPEDEKLITKPKNNTTNQFFVLSYENGTHKLTTDRFENSSDPNKFSNVLGTTPETVQLCIRPDNVPAGEETLLCYINNEYEGGLSDYKHIGIQLGSDVYIPKNCLKINLCSKPNGEGVFASVNLPTTNAIYYPLENKNNHPIILSQIFKKINSDEKIQSISITSTKFFRDYITKILNEDKPAINLFLGKIVLYKANTIPIFHPKMRFKFYSMVDGEIETLDTASVQNHIGIRKIGTVLDFR